jgi:signal transduction histidine kinase
MDRAQARLDPVWPGPPWLLDLVLALALTALTVSSLMTRDPSVAYRYPEPNVWLALLALAGGLSLAVRRRWPVVALAATLAATVAVALLGWDPGLLFVCVLFALYTTAAWQPRAVAVACLIAAYGMLVALWALQAPQPQDLTPRPESAIFVIVWSLGLYARHWRRSQQTAIARALEIERTRALETERAVFAERLRIAGEMHDVVSHTLSVIAVQSAVARHLDGTQPERTGAALGAIEVASRGALDDLRRMLGVLRADSPAPVTTAAGVPAEATPSRTQAVPGGWQQREWLLDLVLGIAVTAVTVSSVVTTDPAVTYRYPGPNAWLVLLALAGSLPLTARRRWPATVLVAALTANFVIAALGWNKGLLAWSLTFALYSAAAWRPRAVAVACLLAVYAAMAILGLLRAPYFDSPLAFLNVATITVAWATGRYLRHRRRAQRAAVTRALEAERARVLEAERAVFAERLRIAREMHDVVAHTLSVIAVQSAVAHHLIGSQPQKAGPALAAIEDASRGAMNDLRRMLGVLQLDAAQSEATAALTPAPGLTELELLASAHRSAHGPVELVVEPSVESAPESLRLAVYRLVQEALTNARKHAPGARVRVSVLAVDGKIVVQIDDDGTGEVIAPAFEGQNGSGYGLAGMRERAAMFGGTLRAGPRQDGGGFQVVATLHASDPEAGAQGEPRS